MDESQQRILVVVDPTVSDEQTCVERAAWLAEKLDLGLELFICYYEPIIARGGAAHHHHLVDSKKFAVRMQREKLEKIAEGLREKGIDVIVSAVWDGQLGDGILRQVLRTNPRIVVKDTHYHNIAKRTIFSHTDWHLIRLCTVPLWLTKNHQWPDKPQILASVDPTHESDTTATLDEAILGEALMLRESLDADLHVYHGYVPISPVDYAAMNSGIVPTANPLPVEELTERIRKDHKKYLDELLQRFELDEDHGHLLPGTPEKVLPRFAEEQNADLVVMGAVARGFLERIIIGSTTEKVLDKMPCDLLIVKPEWFTTNLTASAPDFYEGTRDELPGPHDRIAAELDSMRHLPTTHSVAGNPK